MNANPPNPWFARLKTLSPQGEKRLWLEWWTQADFKQRFLPLLIAVVYLAIYVSSGFYRSDHANIAGAALVLWYGGPRLRPVFRFLLPALLVAVIYDSMRFYSDLIRGPIHVEEPYLFDKRFFGISTPEGVLTPNEWFQKHTHWFLDLITGFFYLAFIAVYILISAYFCFVLPLTGTRKRTAEFIRDHAYRPMWAFFWVNMIGYSTYYWYAAAPPWYVADHGLGPADLSVAASAAGALRFDALLGTHFFTGMYGRAADVFGAIPSLHVAYPLQAAYYAHRYGALRLFSIFFYAIMCFSAVYLNHHYVLDILWGSSYAIGVVLFLDWLGKRKSATAREIAH
jgi:membrane-associated phospholipid phosphatase